MGGKWMKSSTVLLKRVLLCISIVSLALVTACSSAKDNNNSSVNEPAVETGTKEEAHKLTAFEKDTVYLLERGFTLPEQSPESTMDEETLLALLSEAYEAV